MQTDGRIDAWVAAVGTGATFVGVARALRAADPAVRCFAVEPQGAEPLAGKAVTKSRHLLQGTGYGAIPPHLQGDLAYETIAIDDDFAAAVCRDLAVKEGLDVGYSAAANVAAAMTLLRRDTASTDMVVATVLCDTGLKY